MDNMTGDQNEWYTFRQADDIDTPALILYPDRMIQNIERLKAMVTDLDMLRPHVKTHKSADVTKLLILHGINKFKCATITEAEMLGQCKAKDVLLAYQPTVPKVKRFLELIAAYPETKYSCLVDNLESAQMIAMLALEKGLTIAIYIDLNVGMNRTGISPFLALDLFIEISMLKGLILMGFHAYDGHIRDKDLKERTTHCDIVFQSVEELRDKVRQNGYPYPLLIVGGSPTFHIHSKRDHVECSPGTFIFWDKGYHDTIPEQEFLFAAIIISRIISMPESNKICIDLGYKSIASENELQNRIWFLNAPDLKPYSQSEEHMVIEVGESHNYKLGDLFYVVPVHICPTIAMYNQGHTVRGRNLHSQWPIHARDHETLFLKGDFTT